MSIPHILADGPGGARWSLRRRPKYLPALIKERDGGGGGLLYLPVLGCLDTVADICREPVSIG